MVSLGDSSALLHVMSVDKSMSNMDLKGRDHAHRSPSVNYLVPTPDV